MTGRDTILLESGTNEVEIIEFYLNGISYGINVSKVQRVIARSAVEITSVAQAPHGTIGIIHIHGNPVILLDLKVTLGLGEPTEPIDPERQLVLVTHFNNQTTAYLIDGISKIHRTSWENFVPISHRALEGGGGYSTGTVTFEDNMIIILDLEQLILTLFPSSKRVTDAAAPSFREERTAVRILYAEDSKVVRNLTLDLLRQAGYRNVDFFENGLEAANRLAAIRGEKEEAGYDLVLTDIEMPQMDGLTLCRKIKSELYPENAPKVVVYSSLINKEMITKCRSVGADHQLAKPEVEQIVDVIDSLCLAEVAEAAATS